MRKLVFLVVTGMISAVLAAPAVARGPASKHLRVQILLPAPGHITLESISATVRHPSAAARKSGLLNPRFIDAGSLPPSARILYLRRTFRKGGSVKTVVLFLVINRATATGAAGAASMPLAAPDGPPEPLGPQPLEGDPDVILKVLGALAYPPKTYDFSYRDSAGLHGGVTARAVLNADDARNAKQVGQVKRTIDDLFNGHAPSDADVGNLATDPNLDTGHYDDGHSFAWKAPDKMAIATLTGELAHDQPQNIVPHVEIVIHADINGNGTIGTTPKQQPYRFSFGPLGLSFDDTVPISGGQPVVEHLSVQIQGGTACGTNVATAAFELPWTLTVSGGTPQPQTALESFAANPFRFYNFHDTDTNSTLAMNLRLLTGPSPTVQVEETHSGSGISNVSVSPQQAAVTATPVSSTC